MNEIQATAVAEALGGEMSPPLCHAWPVQFPRSDGRKVVVSAEVVCEYADDEAFEKNQCSSAILLH